MAGPNNTRRNNCSSLYEKPWRTDEDVTPKRSNRASYALRIAASTGTEQTERQHQNVAKEGAEQKGQMFKMWIDAGMRWRGVAAKGERQSCLCV